EERVKSPNISNANKQAIFEYESYCFADGIKVVRVIKHLMELKIWQRCLKKSSVRLPNRML
ncbi:MAG TPA: hypothetical protein VIO11_05710, partial [Candidatus Methanoperedens sp.]